MVTRMSLDIPTEDLSKFLKDFIIPSRMFQVNSDFHGKLLMRPSTSPLEVRKPLYMNCSVFVF